MRDPLDVSDPRQRRQVIAMVLLLAAVVVFALILRPSWINIVLIVIGLTLVVMLHEFGHYWTAKKSGMKVTEFFVGFGPRIWSFRRGETEYGLKALPLGGYVRIIGMNNTEEVAPEDEPRTYRAAKTSRKLFVILAGITVNLILAYVCIVSVLAFRGIETGTTPVVGNVVSGQPAATAGIQPGDKILSINGTPITDFSGVSAAVRTGAGQPLAVVVQRNGQPVTVQVTPVKEADGVVRIGVVSGGSPIYQHYSPIAAFGEGFVIMGRTGATMVAGIGKLVTPSFLKQYANTVTSGNTTDPNRPRTVVGIATETNNAMARDWWALIIMLGSLNLFLAIFNLIPLLPFDGGHAVIAGYEGVASKIRKRKVVVDYNRLMPVAFAVFVILIILAVPALILDIAQIAN